MIYRQPRVKGAASFRRLLRRLPGSANARLVAFLQEQGPKLAEQMRARLPVLAIARKGRIAGALRAGIKWRVNEKSLNLKVGLLDTPRGRAKLFYGHIIDVGRKAQTTKATAKRPHGIRVRALQGRFVVSRGMADFKASALPGYRRLMDSILSDAARGAGND